ncbi:carboxymethylenebutenolidase [Rhodococcus rhodnii]|uniref:Carboxymethylenebutenolidase n=2 Tax=Rhodococcus rhodnii TaxID=38312 RepID=A0A6P2C9L3_9NOCA|nr:dienelactone hydrolase family protein [Rhodococcus rhodnii]EOM74598.1 putative carboxymethylenebutenolidase [Rhodococcus rhodnii LMG 5362]TXG89439.1 carboxymethylenebutenolidase [Rhodococcus rhodnii]
MAGITTENVPLRDDSATVPLAVAEPDGRPVRGGIVVLHESRRFGESVRQLLRSLADEGWLAVAPDLFHRRDDGDVGVFGSDLFDDFDASFDWLLSRGVTGDRVGVLGFDDAGTAAVTVAVERPVGAAVSVAARGVLTPLAPGAPALVEAVATLAAPWLALYGDDDDETTPEHVERLREAAAHAPVAALVVSYRSLAHRRSEPSLFSDGVDGFSDGADEEDVLDARDRVFEWFDGNLR